MSIQPPKIAKILHRITTVSEHKRNSMLFTTRVFIIICTFTILQETFYVFARRKSHNNQTKIDDFIDKLLASKKFDVLAEKLAQKAVERMINLKPNLRLGKDFTKNVNEDAPQKIVFKNVSYKTDILMEETHSPLKNLSLKYKYFTKGAFYDMHVDKNKEITDTKDGSETDTKKTTNNDNKTELDDNEDEDSINISDLETSLIDKPEKTNDSLTLKDGQNQVRVLLSQNETKKQEKIKEDSSLSKENERNEELFSENELVEGHKKNESHISGFTSDFDKNVKMDRALFSKETKEPRDNKIKKPIRKRIHREGNRVYTFQSSSDYEEYHQELERVEKKRKVFV